MNKVIKKEKLHHVYSKANELCRVGSVEQNIRL